jgi:membrane peptidoglycan carboxypeptidase
LDFDDYAVAVKTGTSQGYRDAWAAAFSDRLLVVTWVGNHDLTRMNKISGAAAAPAGAAPGCGVTVHVHNQRNSTITVQWAKSDSRAHTLAGAGWWKKLGSGSQTIQASDTGSKAFTLDFSCSTKHQYRVHYTKGSSSGYVYYPANSWTTKSSFTVKVK